MTTHQNHHHAPHVPTGAPADTDADDRDVPAVIAVLETLSELADLIHRHRLAVAALKQELAELQDALAVHEAQALVHADAGSADRRKAIATLELASDGDFQALRRRERDIKRELQEREADIERASHRLRITLQAVPLAQAVDALSQEREPERPGDPPTHPDVAGAQNQEAP
jgi:hypothetical protein